MIIRLSFSDNDITNYFEEFCKGLRDKMFVTDEEWPKRQNYDSVDRYCQAWFDYDDRKKALYETRCYLMTPDNQFKKGSKEHRQICEEVLRLWRLYAPTVQMDNWGDPKVSIQYELKEQWENGEATYYWTAYDRCITQ